jgi:hypothetical protein
MNAGTAEPYRVSPPEAVIYLNEISEMLGVLLSLRQAVAGKQDMK